MKLVLLRVLHLTYLIHLTPCYSFLNGASRLLLWADLQDDIVLLAVKRWALPARVAIKSRFAIVKLHLIRYLILLPIRLDGREILYPLCQFGTTVEVAGLQDEANFDLCLLDLDVVDNLTPR
jgi:hypothetical protein